MSNIAQPLSTCPRCGSVVSGSFCQACGRDAKPFRQRLWSWVRKYPRATIWIIIIALGAGYSLIDENVDFFAKHAPAVNAAIHAGEISSEGDAIYDVEQWSGDLQKLNADTKSQDYPHLRQEMLARTPYLNDLVARNEKFQARVQTEAGDHLDVGDQCESLAIHQFAPLMAQYTRSYSDLFNLLQADASASSASNAEFSRIADRQTQIEKELTSYLAKSNAAGCK